MPVISPWKLRPQMSLLVLLSSPWECELSRQVRIRVDGLELAHVVASKHLEGLVFFYYCVRSPLPL
jgi:hypothetical protein